MTRKERLREKRLFIQRLKAIGLSGSSPVGRLKQEMLEAYGDRCVNCGEADPSQLQLDHVNNNGAAHRRLLYMENSRSGSKLYAALKRLGWPNREPYLLQVLCLACHRIKSSGPQKSLD